MKNIHIITKTLFQIFIYALEVFSIAGILTFVSCVLFGISNKNLVMTVIERFILFYGIYQLAVVIILSNINDIQADEYLALHTASEYAVLAVESKESRMIDTVKEMINKQLDTGLFNDLQVRKHYIEISQDVDKRDIISLKCVSIHSEHCYEISKLNWKYSFLLRLIK